MTLQLAVILAVAAPLVGAIVSASMPAEERRWSALGALIIAFAGSAIVGAANAAHLDMALGAEAMNVLDVHAVPATVMPAMILAAICLVLAAGEQESRSDVIPWTLAALSFELLALAATKPLVLVAAEAGAAGILTRLAWKEGLRAQAVYLVASLALLVGAGVALASSGAATFEQVRPVSAWLLVAAGLVRLGILPFATGLLSSMSSGVRTATLATSLPFGGVLLLSRPGLVLDQYPDLAQAVTALILLAAPIGALLAITQRELGRSFGYLLVAIHALVAVGALASDTTARVGSEVLWTGILLAGAGLGAAIQMVELRVGKRDLSAFEGLHRSMPFLSLMFLLLGIALAGAPGTLEYIAEDVLLVTAHAHEPVATFLVVAAIAAIGFAVLRMQFRLFFGANPAPIEEFAEKPREKAGLLLVTAALFIGGVAPGLLPLVASVTTP